MDHDQQAAELHLVEFEAFFDAVAAAFPETAAHGIMAGMILACAMAAPEWAQWWNRTLAAALGNEGASAIRRASRKIIEDLPACGADHAL